MPDEQTEQMPDVELEQSAPAEEQAEPVAEDEVGAVADEDAGAVAESIDWSRPDEVRRALENPEYRGIRDLLEEQRLNSENTAKQRFEAELRRQAASDEVLAQAAQGLARELGVADDNDAVQRYVQSFGQPHNQRAVVETAKSWIESAKAGLSDEGKQGIDTALSIAEDDPQKLVDIVGQLWSGYGARAMADGRNAYEQELQEMKPEDLRRNPALLSLFTKWQEAEAASEAKAEQVRAKSVDPGPRSSKGAPQQPPKSTYASMTSAQLAALPDEDYERAKRVLLGL